jgi:hypothetical protein
MCKLKKLGLSFVITMAVLFLGIARAAAAEPVVISGSSTLTTPGPYEGVFDGYVSSDNGSRAPITLDLTQRGEDVEGVVTLGEGLYVNAGMCGGTSIPTSEQEFAVSTEPGKPDQLSTLLTFDVSGYQIGVNLESLISEDGNEITSQVNIDLPWICGRDVMLTGILYRIE